MRDEQLANVVLWPSHILIRHRDVATRMVCFSHARWTTSMPLPARTRAEARDLARSLAGQLRTDPGLFESYARLHSEDQATADLGGSLGAISALQMERWAPVLDTLAVLKENEVSEVIETEFGFHVFKRRAAPENELVVSGARLVVGYDDAAWLRIAGARGAVPNRSRAEALELAQSLSQRARRQPESFAELVRQHSEHRDAQRGGDIGQ